jgi:hypothetical protein
MLCDLPLLGEAVREPLTRIAETPDFRKDSLEPLHADIALICDTLIAEIQRQGLASSGDRFMTAQGEEIQRSIVSPDLRNLPAHYEI